VVAVSFALEGCWETTLLEEALLDLERAASCCKAA